MLGILDRRRDGEMGIGIGRQDGDGKVIGWEMRKFGIVVATAMRREWKEEMEEVELSGNGMQAAGSVVVVVPRYAPGYAPRYADTIRDSCSAVHGDAAHDDALVPNIDDIPGEQGYVQYGAYAYFMHGTGPAMGQI
ncbi:hypothetical protein V493_06133 [Pseudogymnoascus sp. VKM F-4281 (FW-2241)]|nr:hypothetical protein V493_06133 [Pseudogymnoascus sp. VKM F-4281 (FW-2241)]